MIALNEYYTIYTSVNNINTIDEVTQHYFDNFKGNGNYEEMMAVWDIIKEFDHLPNTRIINDLIYLEAFNLYHM